jgi:hypothetical protein
MALTVGSENADSGMSQAIYAEVDRLLSPPLVAAVNSSPDAAKPKAQEALDAARAGWRKLSYAIASGVVSHVTANMEVFGIQTRGNVPVTASGSTGAAPPANHVHTVSISGQANDITFTQINDGTGRVR